MLYSGDDFYDDEITSGLSDSIYGWRMDDDGVVRRVHAEDIPVDISDERRA